jgi:hypothetical protein
VSRKGYVATIPITVTEVEGPSVPGSFGWQHDQENIGDKEGIVLHIEIGRKTLALVLALFFPVAYTYVNVASDILGSDIFHRVLW